MAVCQYHPWLWFQAWCISPHMQLCHQDGPQMKGEATLPQTVTRWTLCISFLFSFPPFLSLFLYALTLTWTVHYNTVVHRPYSGLTHLLISLLTFTPQTASLVSNRWTLPLLFLVLFQTFCTASPILVNSGLFHSMTWGGVTPLGMCPCSMFSYFHSTSIFSVAPLRHFRGISV